MRHKKARLQLNRFTSWRRATLISLSKALLIHQSIRTTQIKAKAARAQIEKLISLGKENSLSAKREAYKVLGSHRLVSLLFNEIAPRFTNRIGGYTRILNLGPRRGDNAHLVVLELTEILKAKKPKKIEAPAEKKPEIIKEEPLAQEEKKFKPEVTVKEKPPITKKPTKKFLGGLRRIFKKERDSL